MDPIIANLALNLGGQVLNHFFPDPAPQAVAPQAGDFARHMEGNSGPTRMGVIRVTPVGAGQIGNLSLAEARRTLSGLFQQAGAPRDLASIPPGTPITLSARPDGGWSLQVGDEPALSISPDSPAFSQATLLAAQLEAIDFQEISSPLPGHASGLGNPDLHLSPGYASWSFSW